MSIEFTAKETVALIDLLVGTIESHPFPQSVHVQLLRAILEKIRPRPEPLDDEAEQGDLYDPVEQ